MSALEQAKDALETARHADNGSVVDRKLAEAQAAATVALAEQQRIANLIAVGPITLVDTPEGRAIAKTIADLVVEGLGL